MKKIMNFRPIVMLCLSLILGIICATFVFVGQSLKLVFLIMSALVFISLVILAIIFKKKFIVLLSVAVLVFAVPISVIFANQKLCDSNMKYDGEEIVVFGRVCENYTFSSGGYLCLTLDSVEFIGANYKEEVKGKVRVYIAPQNNDLSKLTVGRFVSCFGEVNVNNLNDGSKYSLSNLSNNIVATTFAKYSSLSVKDESKASLDEKARDYVYQKLQGFNTEYAEIGYGIMFGEDSFIEEEIIGSFRTTGIAHILSVSGLHISIIVGVVIFVLSKLKTSNRVNLAIMSIILIICAYFCGFSVSVIRASIMAIAFLYFKARHKNYDRLSSLSLSAFLILLFKPLKLFNVSFILSYTAVLSIILLTHLFERLFDKCFYLKMAKSLAVIFAVQLGLMLVQLYFFKQYSPVSILCNFVTIPISTVAFVILIVGTLVSLLFPFMSFILKAYDCLMGIIVRFNFTLSKTALVFVVNNLNFFVVLLGLLFIVIISDYLFIKKRYKAIGASSVFALALVLLLA